MSNINTTNINGNYPTPGVNNSTQGMRDNFTNIKNNLTVAKDEITDLQNKVIVKAALNDTTLNNDMAGATISNATIKGFRSQTWGMSAGNLGSSIVVDVSKGDVQYGNVVQNTTINFGGWSPAGTQSSVQLNLTIGNASAILQLPNTSFNSSTDVVSGMKNSIRLVENYSANASPAPSSTISNYISIPAGVKELQLKFTTIDCGTTIDVTPVNRNQVASSVTTRTPTAIGSLGDVPGTICSDGNFLYLCIGQYNGSTAIWKKITLSNI